MPHISPSPSLPSPQGSCCDSPMSLACIWVRLCFRVLGLLEWAHRTLLGMMCCSGLSICTEPVLSYLGSDKYTSKVSQDERRETGVGDRERWGDKGWEWDGEVGCGEKGWLREGVFHQVPSLESRCSKIESYYTGSDAHRMWQGLKAIMDYKGKPRRELPSDASLPDKLNAFYARFEASNTEACMRAPAVPNDCVITLSIANVRPLNRLALTFKNT